MLNTARVRTRTALMDRAGNRFGVKEWCCGDVSRCCRWNSALYEYPDVYQLLMFQYLLFCFCFCFGS